MEALSYIVVILGVPVFVLQQYQDQDRRRVDTTLSYISLYQGDRLSNARNLLLSSWFQYGSDIAAVNASGGISEESYRHLVSSMIDASVERDPVGNLRNALFFVADFYAQLDICITSGACARQQAVTYFGSDVQQLRCTYGAWFDQTASDMEIADFGAGITAMAAAVGALQC